MQFSSIVIAGGALRVISVIGCVKYLEEQNMIKCLKNYVGTSAGSILCLLLVLGYTHAEIIEFLYTHLAKDEISSFAIDECMDFFTTFGINSGENIKILISDIISQKSFQKDISFIELAKKTGKHFVVCVSNVTKERSEFFSVDTTPNMSVIEAIRTSCSIPFIFTPVVINGDIYMDGCLFNNFPIDYFTKHNQTIQQDILGINITNSNYKKMDNIMEFSLMLINTLISKLNAKNTQDCSARNIITIDIPEEDWFSIMDLAIKFPKTKWAPYVSQGYHLLKEKMTLISNTSKEGIHEELVSHTTNGHPQTQLTPPLSNDLH